MLYLLLIIFVIVVSALTVHAYNEGKRDAERKIAGDILYQRMAPSGNLTVYLSRLIKRHYNGVQEWNNLHLSDPYEIYWGPSASEANKEGN